MGRFGEVDSNAEYALKNNLSAIIAPTVNDDSSNGYEPGSVWIDNTGKAAYQCVDASVGAAIWTTLSIPISNAFGLFTQTSDSAVVEDTTTETTIIGSGVGSLSVPANQFIVGDTYKGIIAGKKSNVNNHTIQFDIKVDGDIILSSGPITLGGSTNTNWELIVDFTIRQIGGAGVSPPSPPHPTNDPPTPTRHSTSTNQGIPRRPLRPRHAWTTTSGISASQMPSIGS